MLETGKLMGLILLPQLFYSKQSFIGKFYLRSDKIILIFDQINFVSYFPVSCNKKDKINIQVYIINFSFSSLPASLMSSHVVVLYFNYKINRLKKQSRKIWTQYIPPPKWFDIISIRLY